MICLYSFQPGGRRKTCSESKGKYANYKITLVRIICCYADLRGFLSPVLEEKEFERGKETFCKKVSFPLFWEKISRIEGECQL